MNEMKIYISVLKRDNLPDNKPVIVTPGETNRFKTEINDSSKDINLDILCLPSLDGIAIYKIQDNTHKDKVNILKGN